MRAVAAASVTPAPIVAARPRVAAPAPVDRRAFLGLAASGASGAGTEGCRRIARRPREGGAARARLARGGDTPPRSGRAGPARRRPPAPAGGASCRDLCDLQRPRASRVGSPAGAGVAAPAPAARDRVRAAPIPPPTTPTTHPTPSSLQPWPSRPRARPRRSNSRSRRRPAPPCARAPCPPRRPARPCRHTTWRGPRSGGWRRRPRSGRWPRQSRRSRPASERWSNDEGGAAAAIRGGLQGARREGGGRATRGAAPAPFSPVFARGKSDRPPTPPPSPPPHPHPLSSSSLAVARAGRGFDDLVHTQDHLRGLGRRQQHRPLDPEG